MRPRLALLLLPLTWLAIGDGESVWAQSDEERVVLITLDGVRTEEIFGGLNLEILRSTLEPNRHAEDTPIYKRFWAQTREERRRRLMPFFWSLVTEHGTIAGDEQAGSAVRLSNRQWFSYPGYAEILLGEAHDDVVKSNEPIRNPFPTVLEAIRESHNLPREQVATFASWPVFNEIAEHTVGATFINAGVETFDAPGEDVKLLNALQAEIATPWSGVRFDALTFRFAMRHLETVRPRVLYIALDETDEWAHDGKYDRVLDMLSQIDGYMRELWTWLQNQPEYRGRTHMLITVDHGRGHTSGDWRNHGAMVPGANETWIAFVSPRRSQRGVWGSHPPLSTSQVAATLASWMGVDWNVTHPRAGQPIR